jgi:hypothetical protein
MKTDQAIPSILAKQMLKKQNPHIKTQFDISEDFFYTSKQSDHILKTKQLNRMKYMINKELLRRHHLQKERQTSEKRRLLANMCSDMLLQFHNKNVNMPSHSF